MRPERDSGDRKGVLLFGFIITTECVCGDIFFILMPSIDHTGESVWGLLGRNSWVQRCCISNFIWVRYFRVITQLSDFYSLRRKHSLERQAAMPKAQPTSPAASLDTWDLSHRWGSILVAWLTHLIFCSQTSKGKTDLPTPTSNPLREQ